MFNTLSLRMRLTLVSTLLLLVCSMGLTLMLNLSANTMADTLEASPTIKATTSNNPDEISLPRISIPVSAEARHTFLFESLGYFVLIVLTGGILTWFITGKAMKPLVTLNNHLKSRTAWNLAERAAVPPSHDEVASLALSFNALSATLEDAFATQQRFSQSVAHELRTPLAVLKTKLEVFRKKPDRTLSEQETLFTTFETQIDRLSKVVKDLLELTTLNKLACEDTISVRDLVSEIAEELATTAERRNVVIKTSCDNCILKGNESLLHRALSNLVENALEYGARDDVVSLIATQQQDHLRISIADHGEGIPDFQKPLIFEPFYRIDTACSERTENAGLGLATTKAIISKHGGIICLEDNPGGGCIFTIDLPC